MRLASPRRCCSRALNWFPASAVDRPLALWFIGIGERLPLVARFSRHLHEFYEGMYQLFSLKSTVLAVGLGMISWLGEGLGFYLVLRGLGLPASLNLAATAVFAQHRRGTIHSLLHPGQLRT